MIKKDRVCDYLKGLSLLAAVFLLFMVLFLVEKDFRPLYRPNLQAHSGKKISGPWQFAFLADVHKGWGVFKPIMKEIVQGGYSFAVIGGDIVAQNKENRYRFFLRELTKIRGTTPLYFVPGNHDVFEYSDNTEYSLDNYHKYCGPDHYWFSRGDVAFVVINDSRSRLTNMEFHWLQDTLRTVRDNFTHIFVFLHVPPFDPRPGQNYCLSEKEGKRFMRLMEQYRVDYVFSGHIHCYFREVINEVVYIIGGGAGGSLKCPDGFYHYVRVSVSEEGIEDSVIRAKKNRLIEITGDIKYDLQIRHPFLIPLLTVVMGQSFFYFLLL